MLPFRSRCVLVAGPLVLACGSRTGVDDFVLASALDALPSPAVDAAEAGPLRSLDATLRPDVSHTPEASVPEARKPPPSDDAGIACIDGGSPVAYVLDQSDAFYTFDPATLATTLIGTPQCNDSNIVWDFTVSREGNAYVTFEDWSIFEVDLRTLGCSSTSYVNGQGGVGPDFTSTVLPGIAGEEMLFYAPGSTSALLVRSGLDFGTYTEIGTVTPPVAGGTAVDVKADAFGHLFGLTSGGLFLQIDPIDARVIRATQTSFSSGDWALLTFERDVYFFGDTGVSRYDVATGALTALGNVGPAVVGASAVPCLSP